MKLREFDCDTCHKRSEPVNEEHAHNTGQEVFPYSKGWIFLYCLDAKVDRNVLCSSKDKHFCSKDCALKYFSDSLDLAHKTVIERQEEKNNQRSFHPAFRDRPGYSERT